MNRADILALAERVEKAPTGCLDLTADVYEALGYEVIRARRPGRGYAWRYRGFGPLFNNERWISMARLTSSLDAAMQLVPEGWHVNDLREDWRTNKWRCDLAKRPSDGQRRAFDSGKVIGTQSEQAEANHAALALTAAALRAIAGEER
jgi:hypothetical protein